ncbi:dTDP-4-dehydrorhamnose 3,5-epimerase [Rhodohalobacter mucosus]|uniref:dTDP-4-dehydrorhamnose 3,5-epimerase n=1 Tax=Rhodohalobacter mucosus TaxID=2079485 RepID=A0A316U361_9BACT|nr:dTDP-4-dehydrorhamnose 3,5-epimerase [Rhodohalobacter mucosus]PWN07816.1 dTDP-4-dehydrorhamnose 3,5-epimerase [Rhodohalobacter mucosus]
MRFHETDLKGSYLIELDEINDERGFFARSFCTHEFLIQGITFNPVQANLSLNKRKHTLRGIHYQDPPHEEAKLVRCIRGSIFDVIIDLREDSPTSGQWVGVELTDKNRKSIYIPKGFAHGFLTLEPDSEVSYLMSDHHVPGKGLGIRWNDPFYNIQWPAEPAVISDKDRNWPLVS